MLLLPAGPAGPAFTFCLFVYRPLVLLDLCPSIPKDRAYGYAINIYLAIATRKISAAGMPGMPGMIIAKSKKAVAVRITMLSRGFGNMQVCYNCKNTSSVNRYI